MVLIKKALTRLAFYTLDFFYSSGWSVNRLQRVLRMVFPTIVVAHDHGQLHKTLPIMYTVVFAFPSDEYHQGDVVIFLHPKADYRLALRIQYLVDYGEGIQAVLAGDGAYSEFGPVSIDNILGKVVLP